MELPTLPKANGTVVYVSDAGAFANDGTSPETAVDNLGLAIPKVSFKLIAEETPDTSDASIVAVSVAAFVSLFGAAFIVSRKVRG